MIETVIHAILRQRRVVLLLALLVAALGVQALARLPIEAYPDVTNPMADVVAVYPGQSAEEVERRLTLGLEGALAGTPRLLKLHSVSVYGLALVTLTFEDGTPDTYLRAQVNERLSQVKLPEGATVELGPQASPVGQIYRYTLEGPLPVKELRALQDWVVERRLKAVPGVADVVTFGGYEKQYQVRVDPEALSAFGISVGDVFGALQAANKNGGGGYVARGPQEFVVRGLGALRPEDIGAVLVKTTPLGPVHVRDVATVLEGSTPRRGVVGRASTDEVVEGIVLLRRGENPSVVLGRLKERIAELERTVLPPGVKLRAFYDRTDLVHAALSTVVKNLVEGGLLVVLVLYLFLRSARGALIVALTIPLCLLAAFLGLSMMGLPANLISLGAIDFGVLVEASVIVLEAGLYGLEHLRERTREHADAGLAQAIHGVARPVIFAVAIILLTLSPIFALERVEGRIFAPMAWTYLFAMIGSLLCAAFVVPALSRVLLPVDHHDREPRWLVFARALQGKIVAFMLRRRWIALVGWLAVVGGGALAARGVGSEFLPELKEGGFYVTMTFPSGIALEETRKMTPGLRRRVLAVPEVADVLSHLGRPEDATQAEGPNNLELFIALKPEAQWQKGRTLEAVEADLRGALALPGVQANFSQPITDRVYETISGIIGQVVVKIHGADLQASERAAEQMKAILGQVAGIKDLSLYQAGALPQLQLEIDRVRLSRRGLTAAQVQDAVEVALGGKVATDVWEGERRFSVALRVPDAIRNDPDALGRIVVADGPSGRVTLADVAVVKSAEGRAAIWREDFSRFVALKFNVRGRDLGSVIAEAQKKTAGVELPVGSYATWGGEFENQNRAMRRLAVFVPLALLGVLALLYWNFRELGRPLAVMASLPLGIAGALVGLRLTGLHFSVSAAIGCVALIGQLVLGAVLSFERVLEARAQGAHGDDAVQLGFSRAFRPVTLASALAMFGMLPLSLSHGMGAETQRPFAVTILFGCLFGLPALMLMLPSFDSLVEQARGLRLRRAVPAVAAAIVLALFLPRTAAAATTPLGEGEALSRALKGNPFIAASKKQVAVAEADLTTAKLWQNPTVSLSVGRALYGLDVNGAWAGSLQVGQPFYLSGQVDQRLAVADLGIKAARIDVDAETVTRLLAVRRAFVEAWISQEIHARWAASLTDVTSIAKILDQRAKAGFSTEYDAHRVGIERKLVAASTADAEADLGRALADLTLAIGDGVPVTAVLAPDALPALPSLDVLLARAHGQRIELRSVRAQEALARASVAKAKADARPVPSLLFGAQVSQGPGSVAVFAGVSTPIALFDAGQGWQAKYAADADAKASLAAAIEKRIDGEVTAARALVEKRRTSLATFEVTVGDDGKKLRTSAEGAYGKGGLGVLELLDAYRTERDLALRGLSLRHDARAAELDLLAAIGGGVGTW